jgi:hypothetical protein
MVKIKPPTGCRGDRKVVVPLNMTGMIFANTFSIRHHPRWLTKDEPRGRRHRRGTDETKDNK